MKIVKKGKEHIKLKIDNLDDLWILKNIINKGDEVGAKTTRIIKIGNSETRKPVYIKIEVEKTEFEGNELRILGPILEASNPEVPLHDYHTLAIHAGDTIDIFKDLKVWEEQRVKDAVEATKKPKLILCAADYGDMSIALLKEFGIEHITEIDKNLPGKRKGYEKEYAKSRQDFLQEIARTLMELLKAHHVEKIILGGVGFLSEDFKKVLEKYPELKRKIILAKISVSGKTGINELIKRGIVAKAVKGGRISMETELIEKFFAEISKEGLATYGPNEVKNALDYGAVETLLISEKYIHDNRELAEEILKKAKDSRATIVIISKEHEAGERFSKIGIGALLRYKI